MGKVAEQKHSSLSASWKQMQHGQLLEAPAETIQPCVALNCDKPFLPLVFFGQGSLSQQQDE